MKDIELVLGMGKETKGTYRYDAPDPSAVITTVYIRKDAFAAEERAPKSIKIAVTEA